MKKFLAVIFLALSAAFVFAEKYSVKSVSGTVTYEAAPGRWESVKTGQKLNDSTMINTSVGARLVLVSDSGQEFTIKAMQKDNLSKLIKASISSANSGVKKNGTSTVISRREIAADDTVNATGVSTSSTRQGNGEEEEELED